MNWGLDIQFNIFKSIRDMSIHLLHANGVDLDLERGLIVMMKVTLIIDDRKKKSLCERWTAEKNFMS